MSEKEKLIYFINILKDFKKSSKKEQNQILKELERKAEELNE